MTDILLTPLTDDAVLTADARPLRGAAVTAVAARLPERVLPNAPIAERLGVDEDWILARTGIRERHVAAPEDRLSDLAAAAGAAALERAELDPLDLDLVLVGTMSQDELTPNAAPLVAHALGATHAGAMDVGAACTAFLSALSLGAAQVEAGRAEHVLVIGADLMFRITNPDDRRTAALFADGAGAVVLSAVPGHGALGPVVLGADGAERDTIVVRHDPALIEMEGQRTFRHAVDRLSESTLAATARAGLALEDIDLFVYHQANARILRAVGERLALPERRVFSCIERFGNTSAATLPIALAEAEREGRLEPGMRVLLGAFGAGFTWGAAVLDWTAAPAA